MARRSIENGQWSELPVQSIEYMGETFKSFTEVRWAYIYQQLGIRYLYEPQLYKFIDGTRYKPDFYLPDLDCFVETKYDNLGMRALRKAVNLSRHTGKVVYIFDGFQIGKWQQDNSESAVKVDENTVRFKYRWCECPGCQKLGIEHKGDERLIQCACPGKLDREMRTLPNQVRIHEAITNALSLSMLSVIEANGKKFAINRDPWEG